MFCFVKAKLKLNPRFGGKFHLPKNCINTVKDCILQLKTTAVHSWQIMGLELEEARQETQLHELATECLKFRVHQKQDSRVRIKVQVVNLGRDHRGISLGEEMTYKKKGY